MANPPASGGSPLTADQKQTLGWILDDITGVLNYPHHLPDGAKVDSHSGTPEESFRKTDMILLVGHFAGWLGELWRQKGAVNDIPPPHAHILVDGLLPDKSLKIKPQHAMKFYQDCLRNIFPRGLTKRRIFLVTDRMGSEHIDGLARILKLIFEAHNPRSEDDRDLELVQIQARYPGVSSFPTSRNLQTRYSVNDPYSGSWPSYARRSMLRKVGKLRPRVMTGEVAASQVTQARTAVQAQRQQAAASGSRGPVMAIGGRQGGQRREYI